MAKKLTQQEFIEKSQQIHGNKYDYSLVEYKNYHSRVILRCSIHGSFEQKPSHHLQSCGCLLCSYEDKKDGPEKSIQKAQKVHGNKYDYSRVKYVNNSKKVIIICSLHGEFEQSFNHHISGQKGCPRCNISKGESKIKEYLDSKNIEYSTQYWFKDCRNPDTGWPLKFDFYLSKYNLCIEYQGEQHYKSVEYWGGDTGLKIRQYRDNVKSQYCLREGINLLKIRYNQFRNIEEILEKEMARY